MQTTNQIVIDMMEGTRKGIPSFCSANRTVIQAILEEAKDSHQIALIEATSNQVNPEYGYMGMRSADFRDYVYSIADSVGISHNRIILGGDHLGPLPWKHLPAEEAMRKAELLVRECVLAGYRKIHIDTSMMLGEDTIITDELSAKRGARLYLVAEEAYEEYRKSHPLAEHPAYVIGSEVPASGGAPTDDEVGQVTTEEHLRRTLAAYRQAFKEYGIDNYEKYVIAIVLQTGAEFTRNHVHLYQPGQIASLETVKESFPNMVFEGHSTDYQPENQLRSMIQDGIRITKVGPALTYALREALFALEDIERELIDSSRWSNLRQILDGVMNRNPKYWQGWYDGSDREVELQTKYGFFDRCRYYAQEPEVEEACATLYQNLDEAEVPLMLIHQYLPMEYESVLEKRVEPTATELAKEHIKQVIRRYYRVCE